MKSALSRYKGSAYPMRIFFILCLIVRLAAPLPAQTSTAIIDTVAGNGSAGDGSLSTSVALRQPGGVVVDTSGNIYLSETGAHRIRKITRAGVISTIAGTGTAGFSGEAGPALGAQFNSPYGLSTDLRGNLYVADLGNARVRRIASDGTVTTIAGGGTLSPGGATEGAKGVNVKLASPRNLAVDDAGVVYFSDFGGHRVFRLGINGILTTVAGTGTAGSAGDNSAAILAQVAFPAGLALDSQNALFLADSKNGAVRKIANGVISTLIQGSTPTGVAVDFTGGLWVADPGSQKLTHYPPGGISQSFPINAGDVARGTDFAFYSTDSANGNLWRVAMDGTSSAIVAGGGNPTQGDGGAATSASLNHPASVAVDSSGVFYIADRDNSRIRRVGTDGVISTLGVADLLQPTGISIDAAGTLWIADSGNGRVIGISSSGSVKALAAGTFTTPAAAVADSAGNVFVTDFGAGKIFKVASSGAVSTVRSSLSGPRGLALAPGEGSLIFSEESAARVSQLNLSSGTLTPLAPGAWNTPRGLTVTSSGQVFVADTGRQQVISVSLASPAGLTLVAGIGQAGFSGDGSPAADAQLNFPWGTAVTPQGDLLVADLSNNRIRRVKGAASTGSSGGTGSGGGGTAGSLTSLQVLNGASLTAGPIAPGMLLSIQGSGVPASGLPNVAVLINSILTPVISMSDTEIRVTAPISLHTALPSRVTVVYNGAIIAAVDVAAAGAAPGLFDPANNAANPAARGSTISLFGTGLGLGDLPVSVAVAGVAATVIKVDPAPGYPGLFRVDALVPTSVPTGQAGVTVAVGGVASQAGVQLGLN